jgi:type I restriction enzyme S subunit
MITSLEQQVESIDEFLFNKIPDGWVSIPLKRVVKPKITDGPHETPAFVDEGIPFLSAEGVRNGTINFERVRGYITPEKHREYSRKCLPQCNDIFIVKSGSTTGKVGYVNTDIEFNIWSPLALIRANPKYCIPRFLYYSVCSELFQLQVQLSWSFGTQPNIGMGVIENLRVFIPPLEQQKAIASFLDCKTAAIDAMITKKQRLIELLEEKRSTLINQAVIKGLNPNAPMKDSGIPWIGEIPEHWKVSKPKFLSTRIVDGTHHTPEYVDEGIPFLTVKNLTAGIGISFEDVKCITPQAHRKLCKRTNPEVGDILVTKDGTLGIVRVIEDNRDFSIFVSLALVKPIQSKIDSYYFRYALESKAVFDQFQARKIGSGLKHIHLVELANIFVPLPPLEEQKEISREIKKKLDQYHAIEADIFAQIEKLQEYRQSLITAAVTGKLDIIQEEVA